MPGPVERPERLDSHIPFIGLKQEAAGEHEGLLPSDPWQDAPRQDDVVYRAPFFTELVAADSVAGEAL